MRDCSICGDNSLQAEKKQEQTMLEVMQREVRRRTVAKQLKKMRKKFDKEWRKKVSQWNVCTMMWCDDLRHVISFRRKRWS